MKVINFPGTPVRCIYCGTEMQVMPKDGDIGTTRYYECPNESCPGEDGDPYDFPPEDAA